MKYILLLITLIACNNRDNEYDPSKYSNEKLDTVMVRPGVSVHPAIFETAFIKGTKHKITDSIADLYGITVGMIKMPTGRLVACDPLHTDEYGIPFTQFPVGEFPMQLGIAKLNIEERIAFARIMFSEEPVAKWEFALKPGESQIPLGEKDIHGFAVDAGIAIFLDAESLKALKDTNLTDMDANMYKEMDKHKHLDWRYTMYAFGKYNLAAFTTAFGDGRYGTYVGLDASGKICRFLTDFGIFNWKKK